MTLALPRIGNIGAIGLALTWTALTIGAVAGPAPAQAQTPGKAFYRAELAQPAAEPRAIAGDLVWTCQGTTCTAAKGTSRPLRICRDVQRKFGPVVAFTAKNEALPADQLAKCNG